MQVKYETLGDVIKAAQIKADITVEELAEKVGVTDRYIYRIENEGKKPSFDVLYKLIRELSIIPDQIFFPEKQIEDSEMESIIRMLYNCDERSLRIIKATIIAALESQPKEWIRADDHESSHGFIGSASKASGSFIMDIFISFRLIKVSLLHFGQNSGKFFSSVSPRICIRVLFLQTGQYTHAFLIKNATLHFYYVNSRILRGIKPTAHILR